MPLPLIPVIAALAAGGTLVPHAAGGLIVTAVTGGYVAGTYLSTAAITTIVVGATATLGTGAAAVTGAASAFFGSAGIFGTTIGATGLTGALMSAGILSSTPIAVPIAIAAATLGGGYLAYYLIQLHSKVTSADEGEEVHFSEAEAKVIETLIGLLANKQPSA